jgi:hypothetical protein
VPPDRIADTALTWARKETGRRAGTGPDFHSGSSPHRRSPGLRGRHRTDFEA